MSEIQPIVTIEVGKLQGSIKSDWLGGRYYSFQGIPYAKPPLGNLRFKAPQPVEAWTGIKDATKEGDGCYSRHLETHQFVGSEDCLYLNVYTPRLPSSNLKPNPVMVWIHGGGFIGGSGDTEFYAPDFLVAEDMVIVTINYRLGLLGFAYFADSALEVPGNAGLKDQVMSLKWIQRNILKFGGDPNNVTIFGQSAGGASVHYLMLSPLARGLFHKVICQSGVAISKWSKGQLTAPLVAKVLKLENTTEADIIKNLKECPVETVLEIQEKLIDNFAVSQERPYGIVLESPADSSAFLTRDPYEILASGCYSQVPLMIGYTSREGMFLEYIQKGIFGKIKPDCEELIPHSLHIPEDSKFVKDIAEKIATFYFGGEIASSENIDQYYLLYTDIYFSVDINNAVRLQTKTSSCATYYYRMSVETKLNSYKKMFVGDRSGASHADDLQYLFKSTMTPAIRQRSPEYIGLRRFLKLWTTFAKYGDPNPACKDSLINVAWPPTENNKLHYLEIGENLTVGVHPDSERIAFWDEIANLYSTENKIK